MGLTSYPTFKEAPGIGAGLAAHVLMISFTSPNKELVFRIMSYFTDDTIQLMATKRGRLSSLKDAKYQKNFGADLLSLKGKNVQGIFKDVPAAFPYTTDYDDIPSKYLLDAAKKVASGSTDINSALREANELANKEIESTHTGSDGK